MKALLIIDIQNDYFPGGANPLTGSKEAGLNAKRLLDFFRLKKWNIIHVQHLSKSSSFFVEGTMGAEIQKDLMPAAGEKHIIKQHPNAFRETDLAEYLESRGIDKLVVCGMMTHMCIDTSVRAAKDKGYEIDLIHDACATKDLKWNEQIIPASQVHMSYLAALKGNFADMWSTQEYVERAKIE